MPEITPFTVHVPDAVLDDLRERLSRTRWPDEVNDDAWSYGAPRAYLEALVDYWRSGFDWRAQEARLNRFQQVRVRLDAAQGGQVHCIHQRSAHADAFPLILTHGWPGSIVEFLELIPMLTEPEAHGGDPADAFHVVCPSIPGYGFSDAPTRPGFDVVALARTNVELMAALGYQRYGAQGGDWGGLATAHVGRLDPEHCAAIHMNMVFADQPEGEVPAAELEQLAGSATRTKDGLGYLHIQSTKPQSLGYGLTDSPVGQAAWIAEKFRFWTDCDGDPERSVDRDTLLANITLYWVTRTATSSARLYYESQHAGTFGPPKERVATPTAVAVFPKELFCPPRRWCAAQYDLQRWTEMPRGGHFAALEEPALLAEDVRAFFRAYR